MRDNLEAAGPTLDIGRDRHAVVGPAQEPLEALEEVVGLEA